MTTTPDMPKHRRAQIIDALEALFEPFKVDKDGAVKDSIREMKIPLRLKTMQKRYPNWTQLEAMAQLPALLLNFGGFRKREGGTNTEFAALGETEEILLVLLDVVLKESPIPRLSADDREKFKADESNEAVKFSACPLTDQVSDAIYTVERLLNGTPDLGIEGVYRTRVVEMDTSQGELTKLIGTPFEVLRFSVNVTHIYPSNTSV